MPCWTRLLCLLALATTIGACGGGGGGDGAQTSDVQPPSPSPPPATKAMAVRIDPSLSEAAKTGIAEVFSPVDSQPPGKSVSVPIVPDALGSLILAADSQGRLLLSGFEENGTYVLSAKSTALAMVATLLGRSAFGGTQAGVEQFLSRSSHFSKLLVAVEAAVNAGNPPEEDGAVVAALSAVIGEEAARANASPGPTASNQGLRARTLAVAEPRVTTPLPSILLEDSYLGVPLRLMVLSASGAGTISIMNATPIYWAIGSTDAIGNALPIPASNTSAQIENGRAILEGVGIKNSALVELTNDSWLLSSITSLLGLGGKSVDILGSPSTGFNLIAEQSDVSWRRNVITVFVDIYGRVADILPSTYSCAKSVENVILTEKLDNASRTRSTNDLVSALKSDWLNWPKIAQKCSYDGKVLSRYVKFVTREVGSVVTGLKYLEYAGKAEKTLTVLARLKMMERYSDTRVKMGVCQSKDFFGTYVISNCAKSIAILPPKDPAPSRASVDILAPAMIVGASLQPMLVAKDDAGQPTLLPSSVSFLSSNKDVLEVAVDDAQRPTLTARALGLGYFSVRDQATDAQDEMPFYVVQPRISLPKSQLSTNEAVEVRLVDPLSGNTVFSTGATVLWTSSDNTKLSVSQFESQATATFYAVAPTSSPVKIAAFNSNGTLIDEVDVTILGASYWSGSYRIGVCPFVDIPPELASKWIPYGGQLIAENPCNAYGDFSGAYAGFFYFDDQSGDVVLGEALNPSADRDWVRTVRPLGWRSTSDSFSIPPVEVGISLDTISRQTCNGGGYCQARFEKTWSRSTVFTVTSRTSTRLEGTFSVSTKTVVGGPQLFVEDMYVADSVATGTWSADLKVGAKPMPRMNGYDVCFANNSAYRELSLGGQDGCGDNRPNPRKVPGTCAVVAAACEFGP